MADERFKNVTPGILLQLDNTSALPTHYRNHVNEEGCHYSWKLLSDFGNGFLLGPVQIPNFWPIPTNDCCYCVWRRLLEIVAKEFSAILRHLNHDLDSTEALNLVNWAAISIAEKQASVQPREGAFGCYLLTWAERNKMTDWISSTPCNLCPSWTVKH